MAYKVSQDKVEAVATAYCDNGYKKVLALITAGYKESYARTLGLKLYDNMRVVEAIRAIQAKRERKSVYSRMIAEQEYESARTVAEGKKDAAAMIAATTGKAKLYGLSVTTNLN
ncbi:MAG: hypothetical protein ACYS1A_20330, partial [Planctomycetota bacterium]